MYQTGYGHPYDCTVRSFPLTCRYCKSTVVYWQCAHGSKVFFDTNGGGEHACGMRQAGTGTMSMPPGVAAQAEIQTKRRTQRDAVRVDPAGQQSKTVLGKATAVAAVDLLERFGLDQDSLAGRTLAQHFPGLRAVQVTILHDPAWDDPDADAYLSFTAWFRSRDVPAEVVQGEHVIADIEPTYILGLDERWIGKSIDLLL